MRRRSGRGFSLIEVLVALAVTALVASAALLLFDRSRVAAVGLDQAARALLLAENRLRAPDSGDLPLRPGTRRGRTDDFDWSLRIAGAEAAGGMLRLEATVRWRSGAVTLTRYRLPATADD